MEQVEAKIGRKAEVEESRIIEAAMTVLDQGKTVTGWKLRNIIGAGNPSRLMRVWEEHLEETGGALQTTDQVEENSLLPPDVEESLKLALGTLNSHIEELVIQANNAAVRAADKRVATEYNASKKAREEAEQELAEAEIALSHSDSKAEELQSRINELENLYRQASGELKSVQATNKSLEKQLQSVTKERDDFEKRSDELSEKLTEAKIEISAANNKAEQLNNQVESLQSEVKTTMTELMDAKSATAKTEGLLESAKAEAQDKTIQISEMVSKLENTHKEYEAKFSAQSEQIGELKQQKASSEQQVQKLTTKNEEDQVLLKSFKDNLIQIQNEAEELTRSTKVEISSLQEQLATAEQKVKDLEAKKK